MEDMKVWQDFFKLIQLSGEEETKRLIRFAKERNLPCTEEEIQNFINKVREKKIY